VDGTEAIDAAAAGMDDAALARVIGTSAPCSTREVVESAGRTITEPIVIEGVGMTADVTTAEGVMPVTGTVVVAASLPTVEEEVLQRRVSVVRAWKEELHSRSGAVSLARVAGHIGRSSGRRRGDRRLGGRGGSCGGGEAGHGDGRGRRILADSRGRGTAAACQCGARVDRTG
jgi:hypothetical protein